MPNQVIQWSDRQVETLTRMWKDGASASDIAAALDDRTMRMAVLGKARRLKLGPHPAARELQSKHRIVPTRKEQDRRRADKRRAERKAAQIATITGRPRKPKPEVVIAKLPAREITGDPMPADMRFMKGQAWQPLEGTTPLLLDQLGTPGRDGKCHWPIGDDLPFHFCAAPTAEGKVYCPTHHHLSIPTRT